MPNIWVEFSFATIPSKDLITSSAFYARLGSIPTLRDGATRVFLALFTLNVLHWEVLWRHIV